MSDNGAHGSASPLEGLSEKMNWLGKTLAEDDFGAALLRSGISEDTIKKWCVDARVKISEDGSEGSIFDALEDITADECLAKCVAIKGHNEL